MLILLLLTLLVNVLNAVFSVLGHVTELPFGLDSILATAFSSWYSFLYVFWPLQMVWNAFIALMGVVLTLWVLRLLRVIR